MLQIFLHYFLIILKNLDSYDDIFSKEQTDDINVTVNVELKDIC